MELELLRELQSVFIIVATVFIAYIQIRWSSNKGQDLLIKLLLGGLVASGVFLFFMNIILK